MSRNLPSNERRSGASTSRYSNVSFHGNIGDITITKRGLVYASNSNENDSINKEILKVLWKSTKSHHIHRANLMIKLVNFQEKTLLFKLPNATDLERMYSDITRRREQYTLDGSGSNQSQLDDSQKSAGSQSSRQSKKNNQRSTPNTCTTCKDTKSPTKITQTRKVKEEAKSNQDAAHQKWNSIQVDELSRYAVSVHYLQNVLLEEVKEAGMNPATASIHMIENLFGSMGLIRNKGKHVVCPVDGRMGAAYVHCIDPVQKDYVGVANFMLSYSWSYSIGDIVDALVDFCNSQSLDPKRSYIWICCLCVNQHRVVEDKGQGGSGLMDFEQEFPNQLRRIGHMLAMMSPWSNPVYLQRAWCVFEMFTAHEAGCAVTIVMPPEQKRSLAQGLFEVQDEETGRVNIDLLYKVLAQTKVQNAQASMEEDRAAILSHIQNTCGCTALNHRVNELLRGWVAGAVSDIMQQKQRDLEELEYAAFCLKVGNLLQDNAEYDTALEMYVQALAIRQSSLGEEDPETAQCMVHVGEILYFRELFKDARSMFDQALAIFLKTKGEMDKGTAQAYHNIGRSYMTEGHVKEAALGLLNGLRIRESIFGQEHLQTKESYSGCATYYRLRKDYKQALEYEMKALEIAKAKLGDSHPSLAECHNNLGVLYSDIGDQQSALLQYTRGLVIHEAILGKEHPYTAVSYSNCGTILMKMGLADRALEQFQKSQAINRGVFGDLHTKVAGCYKWMGYLLFAHKADYKATIDVMSKALAIYMQLPVRGSEEHDIAFCRELIARAKTMEGDFEGALKEYQECLRIYDCTTNKNHPQKASVYAEMSKMLALQGDYDEAVAIARKAYAISVANSGRDAPQTRQYSKAIDELVQRRWSSLT